MPDQMCGGLIETFVESRRSVLYSREATNIDILLYNGVIK